MPTVPTQRVWANGDAANTTNMNGSVSDPLEFLLNPPHCNLRRTTTQSIATAGAGTAVSFDTEDVDTDMDGVGGHSTVTNPSRFTARYPGWYQVSGGAGWVNNATGKRAAWLSKNGTSINGSEQIGPASGTGATTVATRTIEVQLATGDYIELIVFQDSGGALNTSANTIEQPHLTCRWVSN